MGQVCSCEPNEDVRQPLNDGDDNLDNRLRMARSSIKKMKTLTGTYNLDSMDSKNGRTPTSIQETTVADTARTSERLVQSVSPAQNKDKASQVNAGKFKALDLELKVRLESISLLASQFELCLQIVQYEHQSEADKEDSKKEQILAGIQAEIVDLVAKISQNQQQTMEKTILELQSTFEILKQNLKNQQAFSQISAQIPDNLQKLDGQISEMKKMLFDIK